MSWVIHFKVFDWVVRFIITVLIFSESRKRWKHTNKESCIMCIRIKKIQDELFISPDGKSNLSINSNWSSWWFLEGNENHIGPIIRTNSNWGSSLFHKITTMMRPSPFHPFCWFVNNSLAWFNGCSANQKTCIKYMGLSSLLKAVHCCSE